MSETDRKLILEEFWIGEYRADYSPLTEEEIAAIDPELEELFRNSVPSPK